MLQKTLTGITAVFENLFFCGILFGWASLLPMLIDEGFFSCTSSANQTNQTDASCENEQSESLSLVFTLTSSIGQFSTILTGLLMDKLGGWKSRTIFINLSVACLVTVAVTTPATSYLFYFAFPVIHSIGFALMISNIQVSNLFTKNRNLYVSISSGAFDSASLAFLIMNKIYYSGVSLSTIFAVYSVVYFLLNLRTFTLMPKDKIPFIIPEGFQYGYKELLCIKKSNKEDSLKMDEISVKSILSSDESNESSESDGSKEVIIEDPSYFSYIKQLYFVSTILSHSTTLLLSIFYISNFNYFISTLTTDESLVDSYVYLFGALQCCGILACPISGWLSGLYKNKLVANGDDERTAEVKSSSAVLLIGALCIVTMQACTLGDSLKLQVFAMTMQVLGKVFVLSGVNYFVSLYFPADLFGKLYGTMAAVSSVVLLLQQPLVILLNEVLDGDLFYLNAGLVAVSVFSLALPIAIRWKLRGGRKFSV